MKAKRWIPRPIPDRPAFFVFLLILASCASVDEDASVSAPSPTPTALQRMCAVEMAIVIAREDGDGGYIPLSDGDPLTIVAGPQGGWHFWPPILYQGPQPYVTYTLAGYEAESGQKICSFGPVNQKLEALDDETHSYRLLDATCIISLPDNMIDNENDCDTPPEVLDGVSILYQVSIEDPDCDQVLVEDVLAVAQNEEGALEGCHEE